jgi:hypothetical protein
MSRFAKNIGKQMRGFFAQFTMTIVKKKNICCIGISENCTLEFGKQKGSRTFVGVKKPDKQNCIAISGVR